MSHEPEGIFRGTATPSDPSRPRRRLAALPGPMLIRRLWRSRDRSSCIAVSLVTIGGRNLADIRLHRLNGGRMEPSPTEGFLIDLHHLPEMAAALVRAHTRAAELALIERKGAER